MCDMFFCRPKLIIDRLILCPKVSARNPKELSSLYVVVLDEVGSSNSAFVLTESAKESAAQTLKVRFNSVDTILCLNVLL